MIQWPCLVWLLTSRWEHRPLYFQRRPQGCPQGRHACNGCQKCQAVCWTCNSQTFWTPNKGYIITFYNSHLLKRWNLFCKIYTLAIQGIHNAASPCLQCVWSINPQIVLAKDASHTHLPGKPMSRNKSENEFKKLMCPRMIFERNSCRKELH